MANNKTRLDDFKFDDFDFDEVEQSPQQGRDNKKERGAISKISTSFASGAKEAFTRPEHLRRFASNALPKGYGMAINTGYDAYRGGAELYNIAAHELRPAMPAIRRATAKALPRVKSFLPENIARKLDEFSKRQERHYRAPTQADYDNQQMTGEMAEIFKTQMEYDAHQRATESTERRIRDTVSEKLSHLQLARLDAIQAGMGRLVGYQDQITHRYQQKSLELQYRQYFTLRDMLKHQVETADRNKRYYEALVHNSALPDQAKITLSEAAGANFRDRMLNSFQQQASGYIGTFSKKLMDNIKGSLRNSMSSLAMGITMSDDQARQLEEMRAAGMLDEDDTELAAKGAGGWAAEAAGRVVGRRIRGLLSKNKKVNGTGSRIQHALGSIPERMNQWAQTEDDDWSAKGIFTRMIKELVPRFGLDTRFGNSPVLEADRPATFDNHTRRSITEVIPGFLARIHHEVATVRSGMGFKLSSKDRIAYNQDRGEFTSHDQVVADVKKRLFDPSAKSYARSSMASFLDSLDKNNDLSPEARSALMRQILADTAAGRPFDPDRYSNFEQMTTELTGTNKEEVARLFQKHFRTAEGGINYDAINDARGKVSTLRNALPDPKKAMEVYSEVGYDEILQELGLLVNKGVMNRVNYDKIWDLMMEDDGHGGSSPTPNQPSLRERMEQVLDQHLDNGIGAAGNAASGLLGGLRNRLGGIGRRGGFNGPRGMAGRIGAGVRSMANRAREGSLYLFGTAEKVLDAALLKAGQYRDQLTNKPIFSLDDIRGPVVNAMGQVVLSAEHIAAGLATEGGQRARDIEDRVRTHIDGLQQAQQSAAGGGSQSAFVTDIQQQQAQAASPEFSNELIDLNTQQVELLKVIAEILAQNGTGGGGGGGGPQGILDRLVVGTLKKGWSGVKFAGRVYGGYVKTVGMGIAAGIKGAAKIATGAAGTAFEILKGPLAGARDIYVKGNDYPSLTAAKMKRRHYQDLKSGKSIKNIKGITGPVLDISNNGEMVLTQEEFDRGLFVRNLNGFVRFGLGALKGAAATIVGGYASLVKLPFMAISAGVKGLSTGLKMMFNDQVDVYVMGEMQQPRLRAMLMKAGRYYSARTGKLIRGFKDIDGPVKELASGSNKASANDIEVLSLDDFKKGIVNAKGKELKTPAQRLLGIAGRAAGGMLALGAGAVRMYGKLMGGALKGIGAVGGGVLNLFGNALAQFFPQNNWLGKFTRKKGDDPGQILKDIYTLLDERLEKPVKIREGSWQDQLAEREAKKKAALAAATGGKGDKESKGLLSTFAAWLSGQNDEGEEEEEESEDDGNTNIFGGGDGDDEQRDNRRDRRGRKRGGFRRNTSARWKRMKRRLGRTRFGKMFGRAGGMLGKVGGKLKNFGPGVGGVAKGLAMTLGGSYLIDKLGGENSTAGKAANTALNVGGNVATAASLYSMATGTSLTAGLFGGGAAAAGAGGAAASAGAAVGGGLLATIGLPVLIGAAVVGAAAYGAYKAYKKYKYGTYTPLRAYRMAQYGVPYSEASQVEKIVELEQMMDPLVQSGAGGMSFQADEKVVQDIYKLFDLDDGWFSNNSDERASFDIWFNQRFKPVFFAWRSKLASVKAGVFMNDADDNLSQEEKTRLLKAVKSVAIDVYKVAAGPFDGDKLEIGPSEVEEAYAQALSTIEKEKTATGKAMGKLDRLSIAMAKLMPVPFASTLVEKQIAARNKLWDKMSGNKKADATQAAKAAGLVTAGAAAGAALKGAGVPKAPRAISNVSALKAIRLRAYGLTDMDGTLVRALLILESDILRDLGYQADGSAKLNEESGYYFDQYCGYFGLSNDSKGVRNRWIDWFENRFMPVLNTFAATVRSMDQSVNPADAESRLKPEQLVEVGSAIIGAKRSVFGFSLAVWSYSDSPWSKEPLNTDSRTVFDNLQALKEAVKKRTLDETKSKAAGGKGAKGTASTAEANSANKQAAQSSWTDRMKNWLMGDAKNPTMFGKAWNAAGDAAAGARDAVSTSFVGDMYRGARDGITSAFGGPSAGATGAAVGDYKATGGLMDQIPIPKGDGNWGALKATILAAAKMAGVSPDLMATMANIESGFRAKVKAGTSSATGLYQFINSTWQNMLQKYGSKYGIPMTASRGDARANALMGAEFLKENMAYLRAKLKRAPTDTELYMAHFMGAGGAGKILSALASNPNANAAQAFPKEARANQSIFFNKDGSARTIAGVVQEIDRRVRARRIAVTSDTLNHVAPAKAGAPATGGITTTTANGPSGGVGPNTGATPVAEAPSFSGVTGTVRGAPTTLPSGKGYMAAMAANDESAASSPAYSATPVPSIDRSSGLQAVPTVGSEANDLAMARQRSLAEQAARATDIRGQETNAEMQRQLESVVDVLSKQLTVQQGIAGGIDRAVALLENIHGNTAVAAASGTASGKPVADNSSTPSSARGARGPEATPSNPPVSMKRKSSVG